ncbi:hypothetical protein PAEPH01_2503 [Pancytospora epiphaga]|nr:hypothetical protein PAEPH01_2503 [Pancytospora epiphaga]
MKSDDTRNEEESSSFSLELVVERESGKETGADKPQDNMYNYDPETMKDKPWLKPGAKISDYFNYGFTERTWMKYCEAQRENREWSARQENQEEVSKDKATKERKRPRRSTEEENSDTN